MSVSPSPFICPIVQLLLGRKSFLLPKDKAVPFFTGVTLVGILLLIMRLIMKI